MATLRRCDSDDASAEVSLDGRAETWIGRSPENQIVLADSEVSRRHAKVVRDGDGWTIVDNGSQNGVIIAGRRVPSHRLRDGDIIRIGTFDLQFASHSPGMVACVRCAAEIEQGSRFCRKCGSPQDALLPVAGSRQQAADSRQQAAGSGQQAAGSRQQAAGSGQQAAGSGQQSANSRGDVSPPQPGVAPPVFAPAPLPPPVSKKRVSGFAIGCLIASIFLLLATAGVSLYVLYVNGYLPLR